VTAQKSRELLFVEEGYDKDGDIVWMYKTRDLAIIGCSHDHRMPEYVADMNKLEVRVVVTSNGW
jgi:hypothetical protein